jgi:hypothetical protein
LLRRELLQRELNQARTASSWNASKASSLSKINSKQVAAFARFNTRDRMYRYAGQRRATCSFTDGLFLVGNAWNKLFFGNFKLFFASTR